MVLAHRCERCGFESRNKADVLRHLRKQKSCVAASSDSDIPRDVLIQRLAELPRPPAAAPVCPGCNARFATLFSVRRHMDSRRCPGLLAQAMQEQKDLQAQVLVLQERLEALERRPAQNNTNCNNTYNIITINNFDKEDTSYLSPDLMLERLLRLEEGVLKTLEDIHFNPEHPENQNVRVRSIKRGHAEVRKNGTWEIVPFRDVSQRMVFKASALVTRPAYHDPEYMDKLEQKHVDALTWHQQLNSGSNVTRDMLERAQLLVINKTRVKQPESNLPPAATTSPLEQVLT